jgi:hypothetical protein
MGLLADTLSGVGYALDTPGALLRGALAGKPGARATGREMWQSWGYDPGELGGLATEFVVDPLNLIGAAGGLLKTTKLGKAAASSRLLRESGYFTKGAPILPRFYQQLFRSAGASPLPRRHAMLKVPIDEAARLASNMTREDFALGKAIAEPLPYRSVWPTAPSAGPVWQRGHSKEMMDAWARVSARHPGAAREVSHLHPDSAIPGSGAAMMGAADRRLSYLPEGLFRKWKPLGASPGTSADSILLHELTHAAQHAVSPVSAAEQLRPVITVRGRPYSFGMLNEPPAYRRQLEAEAASALYDYVRAGFHKRPIADALTRAITSPAALTAATVNASARPLSFVTRSGDREQYPG